MDLNWNGGYKDGKSLKEIREELLENKQGEEINKREKEYLNFQNYVKNILKRQDFNKLLEEYLLKDGSVRLETRCLCGENGCLDCSEMNRRMSSVIREYEYFKIKMEFVWNGIEFSIDPDTRPKRIIKYNEKLDKFSVRI